MKNLILILVVSLFSMNLLAQATAGTESTEAVSGAPEMPCVGVCEQYKTPGTIADGKKRSWDHLLPGGEGTATTPGNSQPGADGTKGP